MTWSTSNNWLLPASGTLKFSYVRAMYDQGTGGGLSLSNYYRDDTIVNTNTYVANTDTANPDIENSNKNKGNCLSVAVLLLRYILLLTAQLDC